MQPSAPSQALQQIQREQEKMGHARKKWVLTDPQKADAQMRKNKEHRHQIEGQPVLSSSYGW